MRIEAHCRSFRRCSRLQCPVSISEAGHPSALLSRRTERILDEWVSRLLELKPQLESSVRSQEQSMRKHFPDALVTGYAPLIETLDLPDSSLT